LDRLAERYGLLPSEVLSRATTLDITVMDISLSYEKLRYDKLNGKSPEIPQEDLLEAFNKFKEKK
jgi:hypothetical protein